RQVVFGYPSGIVCNERHTCFLPPLPPLSSHPRKIRMSHMPCRSLRTLAIALAVECTLISAIQAQDHKTPKTSPVSISNDSPAVTIERAFPNLQFERPIYLTYPPDGTNRIAVISQYGSILIFPNNPKVEDYQELINIRQKVVYHDNQNEEGLLG